MKTHNSGNRRSLLKPLSAHQFKVSKNSATSRPFIFICVLVLWIAPLLFTSGALADTAVSGVISQDTTWTNANSPYVVTGSVLVNEGVTLIIEPGVTVKFDAGKSLQINGTLIAKGTSGSEITFTSNQTTPAAGNWGYIYFTGTSTNADYDIDGNYTGGSVLEYSQIKYAGSGGNGAVKIDAAHPFINYCTIMSNSASGVNASNLAGTLKITNNTITNNSGSLGGGIYTSSGTVVISNNTINENSAKRGGGIYNSGGIVNITYNTISDNSTSGYQPNGGGINTSGTVTISNNTISNNKASGGYNHIYGGGIYASGATISNNTIIYNLADHYAGGIFASNSTISKNIINNNTASNKGGGIYTSGGTISNNTINNNSSNYGGGVYISNGASISNNKINNNSANSGGGLYVDSGTVIISNNFISKNSASNTSAVYYTGGNSQYFSYNTITGNVATDSYTVYIGSLPVFNNNNIFDNTANYVVYNGNANGSADLNAENNYWGINSDSEIQSKIYDWNDDGSKGLVDYTPYLTSPNTTAPISPPANVAASISGDSITLTWDANPELDLAGYILYYDNDSGYPYANSVDVGNVTTYTLDGIDTSKNYYLAVTAYDNDYNAANDDAGTIVNENQTNGNESWFSKEVIVDTTPPINPSISINSGATYSTSKSVTISISAEDEIGVVGYYLQESKTVPDDPAVDDPDWISITSTTSYSEDISYTLSEVDGEKTLYVWFKDSVGHISTAASDPITLDETIPTGTISINSGASGTASANVTLTLSASDDTSGVAQMRFKNQGGNWTEWEDYSGSKDWTLSGSDGTKTVYVQIKDSAGNISSTYSDTIILDTTSPEIKGISGDSNPTTSKTWTWYASDASAVTFRYILDQNPAWDSPTGDFSDVTSATKSAVSGIWYLHVQAKDSVGNLSQVVTVSAILDNTAPGGSVFINGGSAFTNDTSVSLIVVSDDAAYMRFSSDGTSYTSWEAYQDSKSWTLISGEGVNTVYAKFKDSVGNVSGASTDTIIYDKIKPAGSILINSDDSYTNTSSVTLALDAADSNGVSWMCFGYDGVTFTDWEDFASSKKWTLLAGDGANVAYVKYKDVAGNISGIYSDSIILDTTKPALSQAGFTPSSPFTEAEVELAITFSETMDSSTSIIVTCGTASPYSTYTFNAKQGDEYTNGFLKTDTSKWYGTYSFTGSSGDGTYHISVSGGKDLAGNAMATDTSGSFVLDTVPPGTGSLAINDNNGYTNNAKPSLSLSSAGAAYMRFALTETGLSAAAWSPFAQEHTDFDISKDGEGNKIIWVEFKDAAGNIQTTHTNDSTVYDITNPVSIADNVGSVYYGGVTVQLSTEDGKTLFYTTDGSIPSLNSTQYSSPILIAEDTTIKFFSVDTAGNTEAIQTESYIIPVLSAINIDSLSLLIKEFNGTVQMTATGIYTNIPEQDITSDVSWITSDSSIASIDQSGLVTGLKSGLTQIQAKVGDIYSNKIIITVDIPNILESIVISPKLLVLTNPNVSASVIATGLYSDDTTEDITIPATWISKDTSIIDVNTYGMVTAKGFGSTKLEASKDNVTAEIDIMVGDISELNIQDFIANRGNLVLVTGGGKTDALWNVSNPLSDYIYKIFVGRGFNDDDIYFINPEAEHDYDQDGVLDNIIDVSDPDITAIEDAITWASQTGSEGPLFVVFVDHGANQQFLVNSEGASGILTAAQLNLWLNGFQEATGRTVVVLVEACQSGSFVNALKGPNRVIIASTEAGENSNLNNKFSFSKFLLSDLFNGTNLKDCFSFAGNKLKYLPAPWKNQVPQFNDSQEGSLASNIFIGGDFKIASATPVISGEVTTSVANDGKVTINAAVTDLEGLQDVWAIALPPDFTPQYDVVDFNTPDLTGLPTFDMTKEDGMDEYSVSTYSIAKAGDHKVIVYAMDTEGNIVNSDQKIVTITGVTTTTSTTSTTTTTAPVTTTTTTTTIPSTTTTTIPTFTETMIDMSSGWNLINSYLEPENPKITSIFFGIEDQIVSIWKWDNGKWAVYLMGQEDGGAAYADNKGFLLLQEIHAGEGFWMNCNDSQYLTISGTEKSVPASELVPGWNLVGLKSDQAKSITDLIGENSASIASVWKWDNGKWAVYLPGQGDGGAAYAESKGFSLLENINPGEGFWVNANQQITLD